MNLLTIDETLLSFDTYVVKIRMKFRLNMDVYLQGEWIDHISEYMNKYKISIYMWLIYGIAQWIRHWLAMGSLVLTAAY